MNAGGVLDFDIQFLIWGYAITGDVCEWTALLCEDSVPWEADRWRDRTARELACESLNGRPVPEVWALPAVTKLLLTPVPSVPMRETP